MKKIQTKTKQIKNLIKIIFYFQQNYLYLFIFCLFYFFSFFNYIYIITIFVILYFFLLIFLKKNIKNNFVIKKLFFNSYIFKCIKYNFIYNILIFRIFNIYLFKFLKQINLLNFMFFILFLFIIQYVFLSLFKIYNIILFQLIKLINKIFDKLLKSFYDYHYLYFFIYYIKLIFNHISNINNFIIISLIFLYISYLEIIPSFYNFNLKKMNNNLHFFQDEKKNKILFLEKLITNIFLNHIKNKEPIRYNSLENHIKNDMSQFCFYTILQTDEKLKLSFTYQHSLYFFFECLKKKNYILCQKKINNKDIFFQNQINYFILLKNFNKINKIISQKNINYFLFNKYHKINENEIIIDKNIFFLKNKIYNILLKKKKNNINNFFNLKIHKLKNFYKKKRKYIYFILKKEMKKKRIINTEIRLRKFKRTNLLRLSDIYTSLKFEKIINYDISLIQYYKYLYFNQDIIKGIARTKRRKINIRNIFILNINSYLFYFLYKIKNFNKKKLNIVFNFFETEDYLFDFIPFIPSIKSILVLIQLFFRKYIKIPILIIIKNLFYICLFKKTYFLRDFKKLKNEQFLYCTFNGIELPDKKIPKKWLTDGIQIKIIFPFYFYNNVLENNFYFLTIWGNLVENLFYEVNDYNFFNDLNLFIFFIKKINKKIIILNYKHKKYLNFINQKLKYISNYLIKKNNYCIKNFNIIIYYKKLYSQFYILYYLYHFLNKKKENNLIYKNQIKNNKYNLNIYNFVFFNSLDLNIFLNYFRIDNKYVKKQIFIKENKLIKIKNKNILEYNKNILKIQRNQFNLIKNKKLNINNININQFNFLFLINQKIINNIKIYSFFIKRINKDLFFIFLKSKKINIEILINFKKFQNIQIEQNYLIINDKLFKKNENMKFQNYLINSQCINKLININFFLKKKKVEESILNRDKIKMKIFIYFQKKRNIKNIVQINKKKIKKNDINFIFEDLIFINSFFNIKNFYLLRIRY